MQPKDHDAYWLDWLFHQFPSYQHVGVRAYKPSLANVIEILDLLGNPQDKLSFIHVAGTNGKGSSSTLLASILQESGLKVGLFTSPHIQKFEERIRVNGKMIPSAKVSAFCKQIQDFTFQDAPSFFEITFGMALMHFLEEKVDVAVIETGLGGRLDATNVIRPLVSLITNISLDHTQLLGNQLDQIAFEKAGIIKASVPVVVSSRQKEVAHVFETKAQEMNSPLLFASTNDLDSKWKSLMPIPYQQQNLNGVLHVLKFLPYEIDESSILKGIKNWTKNTGFIGRYTLMEDRPQVIFDVSHNEAGIKSTLKHALATKKGKLIVLYGTSSDKDIKQILPLFHEVDAINFTEFSNERSAKWDEISSQLQQIQNFCKNYSNPKDALADLKLTVNQEDTILVFGSFFLIADFFN